MNRNFYLLAALGAIAADTATGCNTTPTPAPSASTLSGNIAQTSFPKAVSQITVKSDKGKVSSSAVSATGAFAVRLEKGASYQLFLGPTEESPPLVLKSNNGRLETLVLVKAGGAKVNLGSVRYWDGSKAAAKIVSSPAAGACSGGMIESSGQPCASGEAASECGEQDGEAESGGGQGADCVDGLDAVTHQPCDGGPAANPTDGSAEGETGEQAGGEQGADCVDGLDAVTHQPCDGGPTANPTDADPEGEMGVPELNAPGQIGCDDEDDDGEGAD